MYIFPITRLETDQIPDKKTLDSLLQAPVEKLAAGLTEQDINYGVRTSIPLAPGALLQWSTSKTTVNPNLLATNLPDITAVGVVKLSDSKTWESIGTPITRTTGESYLWIMSTLWYSTYPTPTVDSKYLQFAIRVDGVVQEQTITGRRDENKMNWAPLKPGSPAVNVIGARILRYEYAHSIGMSIHPIRLTVPVRVTSGAHIIDIVARRTRNPDSILPLTYNIHVFSRKIIALDLQLNPVSALPAGQVLSVPALTEGNLLNKNSIETLRTAPMVAAYNAITPGDLRRASLNHAHLPSPLLGFGNGSIVAGSNTTTNYPGYGSSTIGTPLITPGWVLVNDGAGNNLVATNNGGDYLASAWGKHFYLVTATLHLTGIRRAATPTVVNMGCFNLMYQRADTLAWETMGSFGSGSVAGEAECFSHAVNYSGASTISPSGATPRDEDVNLTIPLMSWIDVTVNPGFNIKRFGVFVCGWDALGAGNYPTVEWGRGTIQVLAIKPQV